ncbi:hypothetical protein ACNJRK_20660, partial [Mycobacterium tuberculosis]
LPVLRRRPAGRTRGCLLRSTPETSRRLRSQIRESPDSPGRFIEGFNPADLTRQINAIQMQLLDLAKTKTEALATARHIDLQSLQPSINRLAKAK